ncbi:MAG: aldehyde ferredoxin oxidoreductase C-terminal domain-containing protein, partial [Bacillota bacterium]|nr:aldehyde ferredoxin oxidoreductase C-terminal domain-containing protein [Bacillota bacterium]
YRVAHKACFGCALQCKYVSHVSSGPYRGTRSEGPEYETVDAWGPNILVYDLDVVMRANYLCNIYGLDTISAGAAVAFAMELYERGLIGKEDTSGMEIRWGDGGIALALLEQIARREGLGRLLGEGCDLAARELGGEAWRYSIAVNGLEASGQDPRSHKSVGCTYATNVRGADHLRSLSVIDELGFRSKAIERFPHLDPEVC